MFTETYDAVNTLLSTVEADALSHVKVFLGIKDDNIDKDELLKSYINAASQGINEETKRELRSRTQTEFHTGDSTNVLIPYQYPITAVTSIHDDLGRDYAAETLIDSDDIVVMNDRLKMTIRLDGSVFTNGFAHGGNNIQLIYVAGFNPIPNDLRQACLELIKYWFQNTESNRSNIKTRSAGDGNITFEIDDWPMYTQRIIRNHKRKFL